MTTCDYLVAGDNTIHREDPGIFVNGTLQKCGKEAEYRVMPGPARNNAALCEEHYQFALESVSKGVRSSSGVYAISQIKDLFKDAPKVKKVKHCPHCGGTL